MVAVVVAVSVLDRLPVPALLGDDVQVLLAVVVGVNEDVGIEIDAGRQRSATPPVVNAAGTAV
jgi:hypothetical protein